MNYSIFLAQVLGVYLCLTSLSFLFYPQRAKKTAGEFLTNSALILVTGGWSILLGLILVMSHNIWRSDFRLVITLIGWIWLLQGALRLFCPDHYIRMSKTSLAKNTYLCVSWGWLLVGLYLVWAGFYPFIHSYAE